MYDIDAAIKEFDAQGGGPWIMLIDVLRGSDSPDLNDTDAIRRALGLDSDEDVDLAALLAQVMHRVERRQKPQPVEDIARLAYYTYIGATSNRFPRWDTLKRKTQEAWKSVTRVIITCGD